MQWLKAERVEAGLTQHELAQLSGVERARISDIENGKHEPQARTVERLQNALRKSREPKLEDWLLDEVGTSYLTMPEDMLLDIALEAEQDEALTVIRAVRDEFEALGNPGTRASEEEREFLRKARRALWPTWSGVLMAGMDRGILKMEAVES